MLVKDFGGWPLTYSGWDESSFDLVDLLISLNRLISEKPVISFYVGLDSKDTSMRVLSVSLSVSSYHRCVCVCSIWVGVGAGLKNEIIVFEVQKRFF